MTEHPDFVIDPREAEFVRQIREKNEEIGRITAAMIPSVADDIWIVALSRLCDEQVEIVNNSQTTSATRTRNPDHDRQPLRQASSKQAWPTSVSCE